MHTTSNPPAPRHPKYRPDIDGLRAVAILAVLGFHAFPDVLRGGFVGVDVFFVISGFLISSIIFENLEKGSFSYLGFYSRRIRRIFPALVVVLIATFALGWRLLLPGEYVQLNKYIASGAAFISNLVTWNEAGYFDNASDTKPLLHLWSLGVEEQFYLFWPLLVGICWRFRFNLLSITLFVALVSFAENILTASTYPVADFYSPLSRFWELMIGGMLAYATLHRPQYFPESTRWLSFAGLTLIILAVVIISKDAMFPGWWALLPTVGAFLIIASGSEAWVNKYLLGNKLMVGIGLISYPLYLWHLPLLTFARIANFGTPPVLMRLGLLGLSVVLAIMTYFLVEKPLRFSLKPIVSVPALTITMLVISVISLVAMYDNGIPSRFNAKLYDYLTFTRTHNFTASARADVCWLSKQAQADAYANQCVDPPSAGKKLVLLWGDSHAGRFYPGLQMVDAGRDRLAEFARDVCPPLLDLANDESCRAANDYVYSRIMALHPDVVIMFAVWPHYLGDGVNDINYQHLITTISELDRAGVRHIVVMGTAPLWKNSLPGNLARFAVYHGEASIPARTNLLLDPIARATDLVFKTELHGMSNVTYFSTFDALCDETGCITTLDGKADGLTSFDYGHLTTQGASFVANRLMEQTNKLTFIAK